MPTYEYVCPKCHHEFEQFQSMRDEPLKKCPRCKKAGVRRLVGKGAGLIFKGTGFYITDYKNKGMDKKEGGGDAKPADAKPGEAKATESKPAEANAPAPKPAEAKSSSSKNPSSSGKSSSGSSNN